MAAAARDRQAVRGKRPGQGWYTLGSGRGLDRPFVEISGTLDASARSYSSLSVSLTVTFSHSLAHLLSLYPFFFFLVLFPLPPIPSSPAGQRQTRGKRMSDGLDERWPGLGAPLRNQQSWRTGIGLILVAQTARACQGKGGCSRGEGRGGKGGHPKENAVGVVEHCGPKNRYVHSSHTHTPHTHAYVAHRHDTRGEEAGAPLSVCLSPSISEQSNTHTHAPPPLPTTTNHC
ncbi:hypothetical protein K456DRAFT_1644500 [Colletotrichum gloeosporioides 23]|nr:hypothetical protein K456DRAFT_1644500 [Colletotrichum gloeosporioides 23]